MTFALETPTSETTGFAADLRDATKAVHREAERAGFIADLLHGRATQAGYALYLRNLLPVYAAMEGPLGSEPRYRHAFAAFADAALFRCEAIRSDIAAITDAEPETLRLTPEARAYAAAVEASAAKGFALIGHAYARYLGDLSGGQILKPLLARTLALPPDALSFYDFPDPADAKTNLRLALDTIDGGGEEADAIRDAALASFHHMIALAQAISRAQA
jgi:heme oxygenase (biliverdin-producing, ferredoxin)